MTSYYIIALLALVSVLYRSTVVVRTKTLDLYCCKTTIILDVGQQRFPSIQPPSSTPFTFSSDKLPFETLKIHESYIVAVHVYMYIYMTMMLRVGNQNHERTIYYTIVCMCVCVYYESRNNIIYYYCQSPARWQSSRNAMLPYYIIMYARATGCPWHRAKCVFSVHHAASSSSRRVATILSPRYPAKKICTSCILYDYYWYGCRSCVIICPRHVSNTSHIGRDTSRVGQDTVYKKYLGIYDKRYYYLPNILYYSHLDIYETSSTWRIITSRYS